jgi:hypothetical protein
MQIQRNASIEPNPEIARCMCHLDGTGLALLTNSYICTTLNAAQSKEVDVAMLPAVLAKNESARGSQVNIQGDTMLKAILPSMMEAMLQYLNSRGRFLLSLSNVSIANEQPCRGSIIIRHPISSNLLAKVGQGIF